MKPEIDITLEQMHNGIRATTIVEDFQGNEHYFTMKYTDYTPEEIRTDFRNYVWRKLKSIEELLNHDEH